MGDEVTIDPVVFWERMAKLYKSWAVRALGPCLPRAPRHALLLHPRAPATPSSPTTLSPQRISRVPHTHTHTMHTPAALCSRCD